MKDKKETRESTFFRTYYMRRSRRERERNKIKKGERLTETKGIVHSYGREKRYRQGGRERPKNHRMKHTANRSISRRYPKETGITAKT